MGRQRENEIKPGSQLIFYLPKDVDIEVLNFLNNQDNISKTLLKLVCEKVYSTKNIEQMQHNSIEKSISINEIENLVEKIVEGKLKEIKNKTQLEMSTELTEISNNPTKKDILKNLNSSSLYRKNNADEKNKIKFNIITDNNKNS